MEEKKEEEVQTLKGIEKLYLDGALEMKKFFPKSNPLYVKYFYYGNKEQSELNAEVIVQDLAGVDNENVHYRELKVIKSLGSGSSGFVKKVIHLPSKRKMAVKVVLLNSEATSYEYVCRELNALRYGDSEYIIGFYGATLYSPTQLIELMEYMDMGSLESVQKALGGVISEPILGRITRSVLLGLQYLHNSMNMIHRDIKPANILLNTAGEIKLSDFGVSGYMDDMGRIRSSWAEFLHVYPERISGEPYDSSTDIWSLGMTLFLCATGKLPFNITKGGDIQKRKSVDTGYWDLLSSTKDMDKKPSLPSSFSESFNDFIGQCLNKQLENRPDASQLLNHPFVKKYENYDITKGLHSIIQRHIELDKKEKYTNEEIITTFNEKHMLSEVEEADSSSIEESLSDCPDILVEHAFDEENEIQTPYLSDFVPYKLHSVANDTNGANESDFELFYGNIENNDDEISTPKAVTPLAVSHDDMNYALNLALQGEQRKNTPVAKNHGRSSAPDILIQSDNDPVIKAGIPVRYGFNEKRVLYVGSASESRRAASTGDVPLTVPSSSDNQCFLPSSAGGRGRGKRGSTDINCSSSDSHQNPTFVRGVYCGSREGTMESQKPKVTLLRPPKTAIGGPTIHHQSVMNKPISRGIKSAHDAKNPYIAALQDSVSPRPTSATSSAQNDNLSQISSSSTALNHNGQRYGDLLYMPSPRNTQQMQMAMNKRKEKELLDSAMKSIKESGSGYSSFINWHEHHVKENESEHRAGTASSRLGSSSSSKHEVGHVPPGRNEVRVPSRLRSVSIAEKERGRSFSEAVYLFADQSNYEDPKTNEKVEETVEEEKALDDEVSIEASVEVEMTRLDKKDLSDSNSDSISLTDNENTISESNPTAIAKAPLSISPPESVVDSVNGSVHDSSPVMNVRSGLSQKSDRKRWSNVPSLFYDDNEQAHTPDRLSLLYDTNSTDSMALYHSPEPLSYGESARPHIMLRERNDPTPDPIVLYQGENISIDNLSNYRSNEENHTPDPITLFEPNEMAYTSGFEPSDNQKMNQNISVPISPFGMSSSNFPSSVVACSEENDHLSHTPLPATSISSSTASVNSQSVPTTPLSNSVKMVRKSITPSSPYPESIDGDNLSHTMMPPSPSPYPESIDGDNLSHTMMPPSPSPYPESEEEDALSRQELPPSPYPTYEEKNPMNRRPLSRFANNRSDSNKKPKRPLSSLYNESNSDEVEDAPFAITIIDISDAPSIISSEQEICQTERQATPDENKWDDMDIPMEESDGLSHTPSPPSPIEDLDGFFLPGRNDSDDNPLQHIKGEKYKLLDNSSTSDVSHTPAPPLSNSTSFRTGRHDSTDAMTLTSKSDEREIDDYANLSGTSLPRSTHNSIQLISINEIPDDEDHNELFFETIKVPDKVTAEEISIAELELHSMDEEIVITESNLYSDPPSPAPAPAFIHMGKKDSMKLLYADSTSASDSPMMEMVDISVDGSISEKDRGNKRHSMHLDVSSEGVFLDSFEMPVIHQMDSIHDIHIDNNVYEQSYRRSSDISGHRSSSQDNGVIKSTQDIHSSSGKEKQLTPISGDAKESTPEVVIEENIMVPPPNRYRRRCESVFEFDALDLTTNMDTLRNSSYYGTENAVVEIPMIMDLSRGMNYVDADEDIAEKSSLPPISAAIVDDPVFHTLFPYKKRMTENDNISTNYVARKRSIALLRNASLPGESELLKGASVEAEMKSYKYANARFDWDYCGNGYLSLPFPFNPGDYLYC